MKTLFTPQVELCDGLENYMPEHNRNGNDTDYQVNKAHFTKQALTVWECLVKGEEVTGKAMFERFQIQDVRPRIAAIKKALEGSDYYLLETKIPGGHGAKSWTLIQKTKKVA